MKEIELTKYFRLNVFDVIFLRRILMRVIKDYLNDESNISRDEADVLFSIIQQTETCYVNPNKNSKRSILTSQEWQ